MKYIIKRGAKFECEIYDANECAISEVFVPDTVVSDRASSELMFDECQFIERFSIDYNEYCMVFLNKSNMYAIEGCYEHILVDERDVVTITD